MDFLYKSAEYILHQFDVFCINRLFCNPEITKELVNDWLVCYNENCAVTIAGKASVIRQFSLYLLSIGKNAYIPLHKCRGKQHLAHVLSDQEIMELFEQIDHFVHDIKIPSFQRLVMEYRVLFRLLFCCGLRVSEARK